MSTNIMFNLEYLMNSDLSEDDLNILLQEKYFNKALIIEMFRHAGYTNITDKQILNICTTSNKWFNKYVWSKHQRESFLNKVTLVYKNVYQYGNVKSRQMAEWWLIRYGFKVKNNMFF